MRKPAQKDGRNALYRHFDAQGRLLYVGVSVNPSRRDVWHKNCSAWMRDVASSTVEWFDGREAALQAEINAIVRETPLHNKVGQPDPDACGLNPARAVVSALGGATRVARHLGIGRISVSKWWRTRESGGLGGTIPVEHIRPLRRLARADGLNFTAEDMLPLEKPHAQP